MLWHSHYLLCSPCVWRAGLPENLTVGQKKEKKKKVISFLTPMAVRLALCSLDYVPILGPRKVAYTGCSMEFRVQHWLLTFDRIAYDKDL